VIVDDLDTLHGLVTVRLSAHEIDHLFMLTGELIDELLQRIAELEFDLEEVTDER
jgi:hypothetical protein